MVLVDYTLYLTFRGLQGLKSSYGSRSKESGGVGPEENQPLLSGKLPPEGPLQFRQAMHS